MHSKTKDTFIAFRGRANHIASIAADTTVFKQCNRITKQSNL